MDTLKYSEPKSIPIIWEFNEDNNDEKINREKNKENMDVDFFRDIFSGTLFQDKNIIYRIYLNKY